MTPRDVIDLQLELLFGSRLPQKIQHLVDEELNQGRWVDGYDLAVSHEVIGTADSRKLLEIVLSQNLELKIDDATLLNLVADLLPQSSGARVLWMVHESGSYALTDSLRVARFDGSSIAWLSPRISYDGIEFDRLDDNELCGRAWLPESRASPDAPFTFNFETGELLHGEIVGA